MNNILKLFAILTIFLIFSAQNIACPKKVQIMLTDFQPNIFSSESKDLNEHLEIKTKFIANNISKNFYIITLEKKYNDKTSKVCVYSIYNFGHEYDVELTIRNDKINKKVSSLLEFTFLKDSYIKTKDVKVCHYGMAFIDMDLGIEKISKLKTHNIPLAKQKFKSHVYCELGKGKNRRQGVVENILGTVTFKVEIL